MILVSNAVIWILVIIACVTLYNEIDSLLPLLVVLFAGLLISSGLLYRDQRLRQHHIATTTEPGQDEAHEMNEAEG